jgi:hypothetical protein
LPSIRSDGDLAALLRADARLARESKDGKRMLRDIHALLGLSRQVGENAPLLWGLVSISIHHDALDEIALTLQEKPALLKSEDWMDLTQRLSAPTVAADLITLDAERLWFDDMLQRSFTDDGMGNGRFTPEGVGFFDAAGPGKAGKRSWRGIAVQPVVGLLVPSRQKLAEKYNHLLDRASANLKLALRDANYQAIHDELDKSRKSFPESVSPMSISIFTPDYSLVHAAAERLLGHRDGVKVGIALELYRREHRAYPENLSALVPRFLPAVPADRITGEPVRYRLADGQPVVYSIGGDRKDDGGRATDPVLEAAIWDTRNTIPDGDWVLYGPTK